MDRFLSFCLQVDLHLSVKLFQVVACLLLLLVPYLVFLIWLATLRTEGHLRPAALADLVRKVAHVDWLGAQLKTNRAFKISFFYFNLLHKFISHFHFQIRLFDFLYTLILCCIILAIFTHLNFNSLNCFKKFCFFRL